MPPMELTEIVSRYDETLRTDDFAEIDASPNGLQVGPPEAEIEHVAFAVDAVEKTITAAIDVGADLLVTHHGLIWDGIERVTGREYGRIAPILRNDLALYVSHLPLDAHPELGNAAGVADVLDLFARERFGELGPEEIGLRGRAHEPYGIEELRRVLEMNLDHGGKGVQVLDFGPEQIEDVTIVTGAGVDWLAEAERTGADALVTGEGKGHTYHEAREAGMNVFLGGHYATETFGVQALQERADEWGLETTFLDVPTGL